MRILFDYQAYSQKMGGVSRYHAELMKRLPEYGVQCALPDIISENIYLGECGIKHRKNFLGYTGRYKPYLEAWLNQQLSRKSMLAKDYDILHPTFVNPYYIGYNRKPVVVTVHDLIQEKTQRFDAETTRKRRTRQLQGASGIICVSEQTKSDLLYYYDFLVSGNIPIEVIYHGSDQNIVRYIDSPLYTNPYLLYVGSREKYKNFNKFLRAFARLPIDVSLVCTGSPFNIEEKNLILTLGIEERVVQQFVSDSELNNLFSNALAFVYPSTMEGFGIPILEAFRCGCPVVASDIKCFNEVGGDSILYFDPNDVDSIYLSLEKICSDSLLRQSKQKCGYARLKLFSWDETAVKHVDFYHKTLNRV